MSETDPGFSEMHAGDVGARRTTVGTPTGGDSINVPPTRPGAADNARKAEAARRAHETFAPEPPVPDERTEAVEWPGRAKERGKEDDLRKEIRQTRRELGETISALAEKADVKARAVHAAEAAGHRAAETARKPPVLLVLGAGAVLAFVALRQVRLRKTDTRRKTRRRLQMGTRLRTGRRFKTRRRLKTGK
ncbi:DUF3618 domain-containing protein [Nonomuraea sp. NPDC046802]|uniref:DUF3618 domain-containing protein n=1 Tax=Nonomuraea sp. NPDC046802 TaxID=3154919 RepID=UPI0033F5BA2A